MDDWLCSKTLCFPFYFTKLNSLQKIVLYHFQIQQQIQLENIFILRFLKKRKKEEKKVSPMCVKSTKACGFLAEVQYGHNNITVNVSPFNYTIILI